MINQNEYICDDRIKKTPEWIEEMNDEEIKKEYEKRFGEYLNK